MHCTRQIIKPRAGRISLLLTQVNYHSSDLGFDRSWISNAALKVVDSLQAGGFDGYLVGGCVRDLLLHKHPKDFDVTTNASPEQIKQLLPRSRIIGRRFKLVHVRFGREIIEVATYRAKPDGSKHTKGRTSGKKPISASGRVVDDNVFGTIEQDASRRDFTINALYYDPGRELVIDFLGGVKDARKNILRMIGDARARFTEDPVRMIRVLRFRAKLGLTLESGLDLAITDCRELLGDVPAARLFDEVLKLFHHGHAGRSWNELRSHNLVEQLFAQTAAVTNHADGKVAEDLILMALENTDRRIQQGKPVIPAFLFAVLLWRPFVYELDQQQHSGRPLNDMIWISGEAVFSRQSHQVAVPRRVSGTVVEIWEMQFRLEQRRPKMVQRLLTSKRFRAAYDFLILRQRIGEVEQELAQWWTEIQECNAEQRYQMIEHLRGSQAGIGEKPPKRRRRRRKNKGAGNSTDRANA